MYTSSNTSLLMVPQRTLHAIIAGAVFDLAGYLAIALKQHSTEDKAALARHVSAWAKKRGLKLHDAEIMEWINVLDAEL